MSAERRPLDALAMDTLATVALILVALLAAACSGGSSAAVGPGGSASTDPAASAGSTGSTGSTAAAGSADARQQAVKFSECMRANGVMGFPDPDASGALTIDGAINGSSIDPSSATWRKAISACQDLQPPGFTGHTRSAAEQESALKFAACVRENGISDFPDPTPDSPLIDTTRIPSMAGKEPRNDPGLTSALEKCTGIYAGELGLKGK